jgi:hypothetical protein
MTGRVYRNIALLPVDFAPTAGGDDSANEGTDDCPSRG